MSTRNSVPGKELGKGLSLRQPHGAGGLGKPERLVSSPVDMPSHEVINVRTILKARGVVQVSC